MKKIFFKSGNVVEVSEEIFEIICKKIIQGCSQFQVFSDENDKPFLVVNVNEILYSR